jgi:hypothetical protein
MDRHREAESSPDLERVRVRILAVWRRAERVLIVTHRWRCSSDRRLHVDVTKILEHDHRTVEELFDKIEKADGDERAPLIDELTTSLRGHMKLEEAVVYPAGQAPVYSRLVSEGRRRRTSLAAADMVRSGVEATPFVRTTAPERAGCALHASAGRWIGGGSALRGDGAS